MKKIIQNLFAVIVMLAATLTVIAQQSQKPVVTKKNNYLRMRDAKLEKALRAWSNGETDFRYHYNKVDLNSDGKDDVIVFISGASYCGSGGCNVLILKGTASGFDLLSKMSVSRPPIWVAATRTKGWSDLLFHNTGGGVKAFYSLLKFNGKTYPANPTVQPALPKNSKTSFVEYLSDIERYDTGFELQ
jgi:uncharacterized protein YxeA